MHLSARIALSAHHTGAPPPVPMFNPYLCLNYHPAHPLDSAAVVLEFSRAFGASPQVRVLKRGPDFVAVRWGRPRAVPILHLADEVEDAAALSPRKAPQRDEAEDGLVHEVDAEATTELETSVSVSLVGRKVRIPGYHSAPCVVTQTTPVEDVMMHDGLHEVSPASRPVREGPAFGDKVSSRANRFRPFLSALQPFVTVRLFFCCQPQCQLSSTAFAAASATCYLLPLLQARPFSSLCLQSHGSEPPPGSHALMTMEWEGACRCIRVPEAKECDMITAHQGPNPDPPNGGIVNAAMPGAERSHAGPAAESKAMQERGRLSGSPQRI